MNNSRISGIKAETEIDIRPMLRARETELLKLIDALENIRGSEYWDVLVEKLFKKELETLYRKIRNITEPHILYRTQGEINWVEKYVDFDKLINSYRLELQGIRKQLNG